MNQYGALRLCLEADALMGIRDWPIPAGNLKGRFGIAERDLDHRPASSSKTTQINSLSPADQLRILNEQEIEDCTRCDLHRGRTRTVFGQGNATASLIFVGEAPGFEEDRQGKAFVGKAGQLLTRMIEAMGLSREEVYICNVIKCRPPGNRTPAPDEIARCSPYLFRQLQIIGPRVLVALGAPAAQTLLNTTRPVGRLRGQFHDCDLSGTTGNGPIVPLMPTYHPAYLLRNPDEKRKVWADLKLVMERLGLSIPGAG